MRLTQHADYAMRALIYLGAHQDRLCSIAEIAQAYDISQNHLMKIVNELSHHGFITSVRGRAGGLRLGEAPAGIRVGDVIRKMEGPIRLVDCSMCLLAPGCALTGILCEAVDAFLAVLDRYTLQDILSKRSGAVAKLFAGKIDGGISRAASAK